MKNNGHARLQTITSTPSPSTPSSPVPLAVIFGPPTDTKLIELTHPSDQNLALSVCRQVDDMLNSGRTFIFSKKLFTQTCEFLKIEQTQNMRHRVEFLNGASAAEQMLYLIPLARQPEFLKVYFGYLDED